MSQENVEQLRAGIESFLAGTSESAREEMLSRIAEGWDPESNWMLRRHLCWIQVGSTGEGCR